MISKLLNSPPEGQLSSTRSTFSTQSKQIFITSRKLQHLQHMSVRGLHCRPRPKLTMVWKNFRLEPKQNNGGSIVFSNYGADCKCNAFNTKKLEISPTEESIIHMNYHLIIRLFCNQTSNQVELIFQSHVNVISSCSVPWPMSLH